MQKIIEVSGENEDTPSELSQNEDEDSDSEVGEAYEAYLEEYVAVGRATIWAAGSSKSSKIHWLNAEDDGCSRFLSTKCSKKVHRANANVCSADKFHIGARRPCEDCQRLWPDLLRNYFDN